VASITVVIISYNTREHLRLCLASVQNAGSTVVVDNASNDGSDEMVRSEYPSVTLVRVDHNVGYGAAANIGLCVADADVILLLNSDTRIQPDSLDVLRDFLDEHPDAGIVGPRLVNPDGTLQASIYPFPTPFQILLQESGLGRLAHASRIASRRARSHADVCAAPWVLGAALAIRRSAFESVCGFDPSFFLYYEEVDLCYRMREHGWKTYFTPATTILHVGGASTSQQRAAMHAQWFASIQHFYERHYSRSRRLQLRVIVGSIALGRLVRDVIRLRFASSSIERNRLLEDVAGWRSMLFG
jgi:GT2 family glycosyltransferase